MKFPKGLIYNLLMHFLKLCNLNLKKVIVFDNHTLETFEAVSKIQPQISVSLFTNKDDWRKINRHTFDDLQIDAVIIVIKAHDAWKMITNLFTKWHYNRDCIVYIFPEPLYNCDYYKDILQFIMRFYFSAAYFICLINNRYTRVYTHDPYGDTGPPYWNKIDQGLLWGKNWTFYTRWYEKDMIQLCPGFNFTRTNPSKQSFVILAHRCNEMKCDCLNNEEKLFNDEIENFLKIPYRDKVNNLKRLLKLEFKYFTIKQLKNDNLIMGRAYNMSGVDAIIFTKLGIAENPYWNYFFPISYENLVIISHFRGFMTPLEKISRYYGVWTLLSLTVILIMTFVVTWLTTKNVSLAAFDLIRLLINTEIFVPINTRPLKIFFSMIFLYFLIIHATFSGHLAEFLTSVDYRPNIETINELNNSKIETIYNFGYSYDKELEAMRRKSIFISKIGDCVRIMNDTNSACIIILKKAQRMVVDKKYINNSLYISKNTFNVLFMSTIYRPGFPLSDRFNWGFMFLFDTDLINRYEDEFDKMIKNQIEKKIILNRINHRNITINDILFTFVLLIIGNFAGFVCFLFEISYNARSKRLKNRHH